jgi:hypothetical protein
MCLSSRGTFRTSSARSRTIRFRPLHLGDDPVLRNERDASRIFVGAIGFEPTTPTVSTSRWALLEGTERYFSRGNRYCGVPRRPARYPQVVCKVVRVEGPSRPLPPLVLAAYPEELHRGEEPFRRSPCRRSSPCGRLRVLADRGRNQHGRPSTSQPSGSRLVGERTVRVHAQARRFVTAW